jgi:hypothetical protein
MLFLWDFLDSHFDQIAFSSWQHVSLAAHCMVLATIIAVAVVGVGMLTHTGCADMMWEYTGSA